MKLVTRTFFLTAIALAAGCGGGGGGGDAAPAPSPTPLTATFTPGNGSPGLNMVAMFEGAKSADVVTARVTVTNTAGIYGAAFDVTFDSNSVAYVGFSPGTLLEQGGQTPTYQVSNPVPGRVVVVATRNGAAGTVNAGASTDLIKLTFRVKAKGSFPVAIGGAATLYNGQNPPQPLPGISWYGGAVEGV